MLGLRRLISLSRATNLLNTMEKEHHKDVIDKEVSSDGVAEYLRTFPKHRVVHDHVVGVVVPVRCNERCDHTENER